MWSEERNFEFNHDDYRTFLTDLREKNIGDLDHILLRYSLYRPEVAEAALMAVCEKGFITYDLYEKVLKYVRANFSPIAEAARDLLRTRENAFREYLGRFSDDQLYDILEDRDDVVKDVYYAILVEAVDRNLIEPGEKDRLYRELLYSEKTFFEKRQAERDALYKGFFFPEADTTEHHEKPEPVEYWICPSCKENVPMNLTLCWNCETPDPESH